MAKSKYIANPETLLKHFNDYKEWVKDNPREIEDYVGKDADRVMRKKPRPLTMEGFENWCADNDIIQDLGDYFENRNKSYSDYSAICSRIKRIIRQDQIEGGMAGIYNQSITQRLNGLVDKKEVETTEVLLTPEDRERKIKELLEKMQE
jgi:hypothetical protein